MTPTPTNIQPPAAPLPSPDAGLLWRRTLWLILGITLARILYLVFWCPYTLIEDEAHYWEWARRLEWSYYTKGPGVAWAIAASTRLLGMQHEYSVRIPAAISAGITTLLVAMIARDTYRCARTAFFAACVLLAAPMFQSLGLMMTIDSPYAACWALAMWSGWKALGQNRPRWLALTGAAIGVGALFKYTILLSLPGLIAAAWMQRRERPYRGFAPWLAIGLLLFVVGMSPIIIWNAREGWPTIAHLLGHLGLKGGDMPVQQGDGHGFHYNPLWTLGFIGTQLGMIGPVLLIAGGQVAAWRRSPRTSSDHDAERFLITNSIPIIAFYLLVSFVAEPEGNWPLAGYITLFPLAARRVAQADFSPGGRLTRLVWKIAIVIGLAVALVFPRLDLLAKLPVIGPLIPVHRFTGADRMAADVQRHADALAAATGKKPFIIAVHYGRASQLAFYLKDNPTVYCASSLIEDGRRTQYDYWVDTNLRHQPDLIGRPAVVAGGSQAAWEPYFEQLKPIGTLDGDGKKNRPAFEGIGFRGFGSGKGAR
ncbi:MAG: glycosyltransferase family 39 protein [Planctomycetota bacterium]|nr:glycosyltransferase family 39 protein [Planctomycetota bacterium]